MVRTSVDDIRETGRNAQGVKLVNLEPGDKLLAIAPVIADRNEPTAES
jgi:DNA gyrase subunit A